MNRKSTLRLLIVFLLTFCKSMAYAAPPVITNLHGDITTFTIAGAAVLVDAGSNASVTAGTAPDFNNAVLTLAITTGLDITQDILSIKDGGQISTSGNQLMYGGAIIGTFSGGAYGRNLKIIFNSNATAAHIAALLQSISYFNSNGNNPSMSNRTIQFILSDGYGDTSTTASTTIQFAAINHAPQANDEYYIGNVNVTVSAAAPGVKVNDYDIDGDALTITPVALPLHGNFSLNNSGAFSYSPAGGYIGLDSFSYRCCDPSGACSGIAKVLFFTGGGNIAPSPANDLYAIDQHQALFVNKTSGVLSNDSDPNSGSVRKFNIATIVTTTSHGTLTLYPDGSFYYRPDDGFSGTDHFTYSNCDAQGACANATCTITVNGVNTPPYAVYDILNVDDGTSTSGNLLTNDTDNEGDGLTASLVTVPANGTVVLNADGSFTYTANNLFGGVDRMAYQVCDNGTPSLCDTAQVIFVVANTNAAPGITKTTQVNVTEDTPSPINSFSFIDTDAGMNEVTVTLSVDAGTLRANTATGVTISSVIPLVLKGSIAAINDFISKDSLKYTGPLNANGGTVTLTITINDGGFTGAGGNQETTTTLTFSILPVNDAPVISVPVAQTVALNTNLTFTNAITVNDIDAGNGTTTVTLSVTSGTLTMPVTSGLTFITGSGTADITATFSGTLADIQDALKTIIYTPASNYTGIATLQITANDQGNTGTGGAKTDINTVDIAVGPLKPFVINVTSVNADGAYKTGDAITVDVEFNEIVTVTGSPLLTLETGAVDRNAVYTSGSGTRVLRFTYTVQNGDISADLEAYALSGIIKNNAADKDALLNLPAAGSATSLSGNKELKADGIAPVVNTITFPADSIYKAGDELKFTVNFSESVTVNGTTSYLPVQIGGTTVNATYLSGTTYHYIITAGQTDTDGIRVGQLHAGTTVIKDAAGNNALLTFTAGNTSGILVDAVAPQITNVSLTPGYYRAGQNIDLTVTWSENITITAIPQINLLIGNTSRSVSYVGGTANSTIFRYTVQAGDEDSDGIDVGTAITGNIKDVAGNNADLTVHYSTTPGKLYVDTQSPAILTVTGPTNGTYSTGQTLSFNVNTDEMITVGLPVPSLAVTIGSTVVNASLESSSATRLVFSYTVLTGQVDLDGITLAASLSGNVNDLAGNNLKPALNGVASLTGVLVDAVAPVINAGQSFNVFENSTGVIPGTITATDNNLQDWQITQNADTDNDNIPAFAINGATGQLSVNDTDEFNHEQTAQFNISVTVSDGHNTSAPAVITILVNDVNEVPTIGTISDQTVCAGGEKTVTVNDISAGPETTQTYTLSVSADKDIFTTLTIADNGNGTATIRYELKPDAAQTAGVTVTIKDNGGGTDEISTSFSVSTSTPPALSISSDGAATVSKGAVVHLTASGAATYSWADADDITGGQNSAVLTIRAQQNATYTVTGVTADGCVGEASIQLFVMDDYKLDATNILTPNGDGINDKWVIRNIDSYPDNEVKIYDRTGRLVYHRKSYLNEWDGKMNGSPLAEGTYYYIVEVGGHTFKGYITIVRDLK